MILFPPAYKDRRRKFLGDTEHFTFSFMLQRLTNERPGSNNQFQMRSHMIKMFDSSKNSIFVKSPFQTTKEAKETL